MTRDVGFRDAIHVPFIIVTSDESLHPGMKVSLRHDDKCVRWEGKPTVFEHPMGNDGDTEPMWHGVVDPFLEKSVEAGTPFAVHLRKECFRELRHDFVIEVHDRGGTSTCHSVCDIF